jgi:hypothetical protein
MVDELIVEPVVEVAAGVVVVLVVEVVSAAKAAPPSRAEIAMAGTITFNVRIEFSLGSPMVRRLATFKGVRSPLSVRGMKTK